MKNKLIIFFLLFFSILGCKKENIYIDPNIALQLDSVYEVPVHFTFDVVLGNKSEGEQIIAEGKVEMRTADTGCLDCPGIVRDFYLGGSWFEVTINNDLTDMSFANCYNNYDRYPSHRDFSIEDKQYRFEILGFIPDQFDCESWNYARKGRSNEEENDYFKIKIRVSEL